MYDLIIVGLGPAGINAAIYGKRSNLNILVLEKETPGGKLNSIPEIQNYIGYGNISGPELATNFYRHFRSLDIPMKREEVLELKLEDNIKTVKTNEGVYKAKAIIIASGRGQKKLAGFEHLKINYCALCDANLYDGKEVLLVGNNNQAIEEAKYLSDIVKKVYFLYEGDLSIEKDIIHEEGRIKEAIFKNKKIKIDGLFVNLGSGPATYFCKSIGITDDNGYITVNNNQETNIEGIYACGDIVKKEIYQIINAASEGAIAALNAGKYVRKRN
jgi:thioredoxin reductase (NADPH)